MDSKTRRKHRNRKKIRSNLNGRKRLSIFRSHRYIYAQIIDDEQGKTLVHASSLEKDLMNLKEKSNFIIEEKVGILIAERSIKQGIKKVVFDKGRYSYHGRIKALAESARKSGLEF